MNLNIKMKRVILCHSEDHKYLEHYTKNICGDDPLIMYDDKTSQFPDYDYYMCIRRVPALPEGKKIGFVNTEQLCVPDKLREFETFAKEEYEIFDFSLDNISITKRGTHLPYTEREEETLKLKDLMKTKKVYDVVIPGPDSDFKRKFIFALRKEGFRVGYFPIFGDELDKLIGRSHCLLHLRHSEEYLFYDSKDIDRWRYAGMQILTTECRTSPPGVGIITVESVCKRLKKLLGINKVLPFKIGLSMIVKDESHIVHEVLNSIHTLIDTFVIVDTGSTDNTVKIIRDFFEEKGIDGIVHERTWKGFGESRSEALALCDGHMDYILMIDADDLMVFPDANAKKVLLRVLDEATPNACNILIKRGSLEYERTQIFKANDKWRYVGVLHEYPTNDSSKNIIVKLPNEIHMIGRTMGARTLLPGNKYARDAETILKEMEKEPENERYMFYLAQSYRDAGMHEEAIKWYTKRYDAGKWVEERFISALNLTRLLNSKEWAWKGHELSPTRIEPLVAYATSCRMQRNITHETLSMLLYASSIPKPTGQVLFSETDAYEWRVWDELAMAALILGKTELCKATCTKLLKEGKLPPEHTERVKQIFMHSINPPQKT
jgi:glycosyltransferase involved in cell wall biosynthesis